MPQDRFSISAMVRWLEQPENEIRNVCEKLASGQVRYLVFDSRSTHILATERPEMLKKISQAASACGLAIRDAHAPWGSNVGEIMGNGNDLNELCTEERIRKHETALHRLGECGVRTYTIHPGSWCSYDRTWFGHEEEYRTVAAKALERLLKTAEREQIVLAVENIFEPSSNAFEVVSLVQKFRSPYLGLCLDCGHANLMEPRHGRRNSDMVNYIQQAWEPSGAIHFITGIPELMRPNIVTVHVHDNNALTDEHKNVNGSGTIDWERYTAILAKAPRLISVQSEVSAKSSDDLPQISRELLAVTAMLEKHAAN